MSPGSGAMPRVPEQHSTLIAFKREHFPCFCPLLAAELLWQASSFKGGIYNMKPGVKTFIPFMKAALPWCSSGAVEM